MRTKTITLTEREAVRVYYDPDPISPREHDNLTTIATWHRHYALGDVQPRINPDEYLRDLLADLSVVYDADAGLLDLMSAFRRAGGIVQPLWLFDHSGITISLAPFSCPWDSGQVGLVTVLPSEIDDAFGDGTEDKIERAMACLQDEVDTYDTFLRGAVYGFEVVSEWIDEHGKVMDTEHIDSCWGFIDADRPGSGALDAMKWYVADHLHDALEDAFRNPQHRA